MEKKQFVTLYEDDAHKACDGSKVLPLVVLGAAAAESGWGESGLAKNHNNFFGRKPEKDYKGPTCTLTTHEVINGKTITVIAQFKSYATPADGFSDYVKLISNTTRYAAALTKTTEDDQINAIAAAGYSTNPVYAHLVSSVCDCIKPYL